MAYNITCQSCQVGLLYFSNSQNAAGTVSIGGTIDLTNVSSNIKNTVVNSNGGILGGLNVGISGESLPLSSNYLLLNCQVMSNEDIAIKDTIINPTNTDYRKSNGSSGICGGFTFPETTDSLYQSPSRAQFEKARMQIINSNVTTGVSLNSALTYNNTIITTPITKIERDEIITGGNNSLIYNDTIFPNTDEIPYQTGIDCHSGYVDLKDLEYVFENCGSGITPPPVAKSIWQDASAIWQPGTGGFDGDISFNVYSSALVTFSILGFTNNTLAYDAINNKIYAAGAYSSNAKNGTVVPFVSWSEDGVQWQDASAIWQTGFDNDMSFNVGDPGDDSSLFNYAAALAYDSSDNRIYAGGTYISKSSNGIIAPFVAYSSDAGISWQDASAIWQSAGGAFNTDGSNNRAFVNSLAYSQYQNRIYAGGSYISNANGGYFAPFVSWSNANDGITWSDASAIWHTAFDGDISFNIKEFNTTVTSLTYVTSSDRIYAGGYYISKANNNRIAPFVTYSSNAGITWQDASAIWHGNTFNSDISFNNDNNNRLTSLTYDSSRNRVYAGGVYSSQTNQGYNVPFVAWTNADDGINWQDASAIWQTGFNGDISFNDNYFLNIVTSLTYDSSQGLIYAGGTYTSKSNNTNVPFVAYSSDGLIWQDASAIWQGGFDGDISGNEGLVSSLTYDTSNDRVYANGGYSSIAKSGYLVPFVSNNGGTPYVPPPPPQELIYLIDFNSNGNIFLNGIDSQVSSNTYYLNLSDMDPNNQVTITNTSGNNRGTVKIWIDETNQIESSNVPPSTFLIAGNNITLDGQGIELDLSQEVNYTGLVSSVANNSTGIIIENININLGTNTVASLSGGGKSGWVCRGNMSGVEIDFMNCTVYAGGDLIVANGSADSNGGICGGGNTGEALLFENCQLSAGGTMTISNIGGSNNNGGICGSTTNATFINCTVVSQNSMTIGNNGGAFSGGICGGGSGTGAILGFINCQVITATDKKNLTISNNGYRNGGICGGEVGTVSFKNCQVSASDGTLTIDNDGNGSNGGICGGVFTNGTFTDCTVNAGGNLFVNTNANGFNGGICGGGGNSIVAFENCHVSATLTITIDNVGNGGSNGGICGGIVSTGNFTDCTVTSGTTMYIDFNGKGSNGGICGGNNTTGVFNFINCTVSSIAGVMTIQDLISTVGKCGGICGGTNSNGTINFTNCQVNSSNNILITSPANNSAGICGGSNNATTPLYNFFLCFVKPSESNRFTYNGTVIPAPNIDTTDLKTKIMIAGGNLTDPNQIKIDCVSRLISGPDYTCHSSVPPPPPPPIPTPNISPLGGGVPGIAKKLVQLDEGGGKRSLTRRILRDAFGTGSNNKTRKCTTPFRVSVNESCNGKSAVIYSGADYIRFKKLRAVNQNYNDSSGGGDKNNASYDPLKRARH